MDKDQTPEWLRGWKEKQAELTPDITAAPAPVAEAVAVKLAAPEEVEGLAVEPEVASAETVVSAETVAPAETGTTPQTEVEGATEKEKKHNKKLATIVVAAAAAALLIAAVIGSFVWYQQPEKVVTDAIARAITAKSVLLKGDYQFRASDDDSWLESSSLVIGEYDNIISGRTDATWKFKVKDVEEIEIQTEVIIASASEIYVKFDQVLDALEKLSVQEDVGMYLMGFNAEQVAEKFDGKWIKIDYQELIDDREQLEQIDCMKNLLQAVKDNNEYQREIANVYGQHQFIKIEEELGLVDGRYGFVIAGDVAALAGFMDGIDDTKLANEVRACADEEKYGDEAELREQYEAYAEDLIEGTKDAKMTVWVDMWSHSLGSLKVEVAERETPDVATGKSPANDVVVEFEFDKHINVVAPEESVGIRELLEEIFGQDVMEEIVPTYTVEDDVDALASAVRYIYDDMGKLDITENVLCDGTKEDVAGLCDLDPYVNLKVATSYVVLSRSAAVEELSELEYPEAPAEGHIVVYKNSTCGVGTMITKWNPDSVTYYTDGVAIAAIREDGTYYCLGAAIWSRGGAPAIGLASA